LQRSPLSEGAKGVLTTLSLLGLRDELRNRDLKAIRWAVLSFKCTESG
jgi:hypothetical protein